MTVSSSNRRSLLKAALLAPFGALSAGHIKTARAQQQSAAEGPAGACRLFPQAVEGPYYFDPSLVRTDITDGRSGLDLEVHLKVIEAGPCAPLAGLRVDIWHADASGTYSGYDGQGDDGTTSTKGMSYLRGTQMTNDEGIVTFRTIYPGWYPGRTPHIHLKVFLDKTTLVTGQIYFPDEMSASVYAAHESYKGRGTADTTNERDFIFRSGMAEGGGIVFIIGKDTTPMRASLVIAVDRSGAAASGWFRRMRERIGL